MYVYIYVFICILLLWFFFIFMYVIVYISIYLPDPPWIHSGSTLDPHRIHPRAGAVHRPTDQGSTAIEISQRKPWIRRHTPTHIPPPTPIQIPHRECNPQCGRGGGEGGEQKAKKQAPQLDKIITVARFDSFCFEVKQNPQTH